MSSRTTGTLVLFCLGTTLIPGLIGCASEAERPIAERSELARAEIRNHIAAGSPELAIGRISGLRRNDLLSTSELNTLQNEAMGTMADLLDGALDEGRTG